MLIRSVYRKRIETFQEVRTPRVGGNQKPGTPAERRPYGNVFDVQCIGSETPGE